MKLGLQSGNPEPSALISWIGKKIMLTKGPLRKVLIVFVSTVGLLSGCNWAKPTMNPIVTVERTITPAPSPTVDGTITFENPSFPCPTDQVREPEQGYPYPIHQGRDPELRAAAAQSPE